MAYKVEFHPDAEKDFEALDGSVNGIACHSRKSGNPGKHWIPGQARNDKLNRTYVAIYRKEAANKIEALAENPFFGKPLGKKYGIDLTGFYKIYLSKKKYRIVYRLIGKNIEVIEIVGIGKRDKEEVYRLVARRLRKLTD